MPERPLDIAVIGAGLGGLCAAACLARAGFQVAVYEQAPALGEVGAGIQIGPNAVRVLRQLGLDQALERDGVRPDSLDVRDWQSGAVVNTIPLGRPYAEKYGAPYYHVHRADLHAMLAAALQDAAPGSIRLGASLAGLEYLEAGVRLRFADGWAVEADIAVGADGIHSTVRESLFGPDSPHFTGMVAFRGTVPLTELPAGMIERKGYNWSGPNHHFVHYLLKGGRLVNCVGVCEQADWRVESWSVEGDVAELKAEFAGWHPTVQSLIDGLPRCFKWALYDRDPLPEWSRGRVTLLGDACHPMLPFLAQGACMALEDGYVLARCLATHDSPEAALVAYEAERRPRTARIQFGARERGRSLHLSDPDAIAERNRRYAADAEARAREMHWIYAHDVVAEHGPLAG